MCGMHVMRLIIIIIIIFDQIELFFSHGRGALIPNCQN